MSWFNDKEKRGYVGSWIYIILVFLIISFLSFQEVPSENKDIITTIIGMLVASLGIVVYTLIGKDENEIQKLKEQNEILKAQNKNLQDEVKNLKNMFMELQKSVINKLSEISNNDET